MEVSLKSFVTRTVAEMRRCRQYSAANTCLSAWQGLAGVAGDTSLTFSALSPELLTAYEHHLIVSKCSRNTVSLYMRMFQNLCNRAGREGIASVPDNLFDQVFTGSDPVTHRAVAPEVICLVECMEFSGKNARLQFARDMFMLSFFLSGISYIDLAHLRKCDLKDGIITYWRRKTKRWTSVKVEPCAMEIIKRYMNQAKETIYLLPIIRKQGTPDEEQKQYDSALRLYNKHLNKISELCHLGIRLTSYVARHSWATVAHNIGIEMVDISEAMCHSSEKMTRRYILSFTPDRLARVNRKVIDYVIGYEQRKGKDRDKDKQTKKQEKRKKIKCSGSL